MTAPRKPGRPKMKKGTTGKAVNLTLDRQLIQDADNHRIEKDFTSLSAYVEFSLRAQMATDDEDQVIRPNFKNAHVQAAAGSPINGEVIDSDGSDDTVCVKVNGLSMMPLLNDGDIIEMRHKRASRNPHMKKGLVYLLEYDGDFAIKEDNIRTATKEKMGAE